MRQTSSRHRIVMHPSMEYYASKPSCYLNRSLNSVRRDKLYARKILPQPPRKHADHTYIHQPTLRATGSVKRVIRVTCFTTSEQHESFHAACRHSGPTVLRRRTQFRKGRARPASSMELHTNLRSRSLNLCRKSRGCQENTLQCQRQRAHQW